MNLNITWALLRQNGIRWLAYHLLLHVLLRAAGIVSEHAKRFETRRGLPSAFSAAWNRTVWQHYDWAQRGEEWASSAEWKQAVIDHILTQYIGTGGTILEIGPGAGRWTETLQGMAKHLILVDISETAIRACQERFSRCGNIEYVVTAGADLGFIEDASVDFIWSWDVFVHMDVRDTDEYMSEFRRVLKNGGRGVIHHPREGGLYGGWRSMMTQDVFAGIVKKHGLVITGSFDTWGPNGEYGVNKYHDGITVFEK